MVSKNLKHEIVNFIQYRLSWNDNSFKINDANIEYIINNYTNDSINNHANISSTEHIMTFMIHSWTFVNLQNIHKTCWTMELQINFLEEFTVDWFLKHIVSFIKSWSIF